MSQTPHRTAASNREVRELIKKLKRTWKHLSPDERQGIVIELLDEGCSIRGIAEDTGIAESTLRQYSKRPDNSSGTAQRASDSPEKVKPKTVQASVPGKAGSKQMAPASAKGKQVPASAKDKVGEISQKPAPSAKRLITTLPSRPSELGKDVSPDEQRREKEESLESMRRRLPDIIVEFIRAKLGPPDTPARIAQIRELLESSRIFTQRHLPTIYPKHLPNAITVNQLYELTKPDFRNKQLDAFLLGNWLAVLVFSLDFRNKTDLRTSPWEREIELAERQLLPQPEQGNTPPRGSRPQW